MPGILASESPMNTSKLPSRARRTSPAASAVAWMFANVTCSVPSTLMAAAPAGTTPVNR